MSDLAIAVGLTFLSYLLYQLKKAGASGYAGLD